MAMLTELRGRMVREDVDLWMAVTGRRRIGKSSNALQNAVVVDPDFDVQEQVAWTSDAYIDLCLRLRKGKAAILDEPIDAVLSFDAMTAHNKGLYRAATVIGERNLFHQILGPSLKRFSLSFREDYLDYGVHVVRRGWAQWRRIGNTDTNTIVDPPQVLDQFDFPALPRRLEDEYKKLKTEFVQRHRDTTDYDEERITTRGMERRLVPVLRRHNLVDAPELAA